MSSRGKNTSPLPPGSESSSWEFCLRASLDGSREAQAQRLEAVRPYLLTVRGLASRNEQAIRLRSDLGLSFAEMGVALSCSANAARKLWARAVKELGREFHRNETERNETAKS